MACRGGTVAGRTSAGSAVPSGESRRYRSGPGAARLYIAWAMSEDGARATSYDAGRLTTIKAKVPQNPKLLAALKTAKWYKPYPDKVKFTPTVDQILENEDNYRKQMVSVFNISTRR